jgi:hypothetical protein
MNPLYDDEIQEALIEYTDEVFQTIYLNSKRFIKDSEKDFIYVFYENYLPYRVSNISKRDARYEFILEAASIYYNLYDPLLFTLDTCTGNISSRDDNEIYIRFYELPELFDKIYVKYVLYLKTSIKKLFCDGITDTILDRFLYKEILC